jgi:signal transduction histidine kinase
MKYLHSFFTNLQWKPTFFFYIFSTALLFFYQVILLWFAIHTTKNIVTFVTKTPYTTFIFYLERAFSFAILLSIPISFYLYFCTFRIHQLIETINYWSKGDFSYEVQKNANDAIGQLAQHLNSMAQELQKSMELQKEVASLNERNLLARELHDTVKQQVFALAFQINIARKIQTSKNDQLDMHLLEAKKILSDVQVELTNLIIPMRKDVLEDQDLTDMLTSFLSRWSQQYGILVKFTTEIQGQEKNYFLSSHVKGTFFRVAQEALSNVGRHSKASHVHVSLSIGWLFVILKIVDNGQGINSIQLREGSVGISSMRERMKDIGGDFSIRSKALVGTEIVATYRPRDTGPNIAMLVTPKKFDVKNVDEILQSGK